MQGRILVGLFLSSTALHPLAGCTTPTEPGAVVASRAEARWSGSRAFDGRVQSSYEHGELLVWGTVEAPHLRRGNLLGYAEVVIQDALGVPWRELRVSYREPVASDPPSAAAVFCARLAEEPPSGWRVVVTHHPRVLEGL